MKLSDEEIRISGKSFRVPSYSIDGQTVVVTGNWIKTARIHDEGVVEGLGVVDPDRFIQGLREALAGVDLFTFSQKPFDRDPRFRHYHELDNIAAIPVTTFDEWWAHLPQESRKNVRRSVKRGVVVKPVPFDDDLVHGIHQIYNSSPIRQGQRFWHYGKDFETVKREHATYLARSEFIGAYHDRKLIGFLKMVSVDSMFTLFHIVASERHHDKRPMNALVAKAVEVCAARGTKYFVYGQYTYGNKTISPLAEFKRRNGFEQIDFPRYYVPITLLGRLVLALRLHRGVLGLLPSSVLICLVGVRRGIRQWANSWRFRSPWAADR